MSKIIASDQLSVKNTFTDKISLHRKPNDSIPDVWFMIRVHRRCVCRSTSVYVLVVMIYATLVNTQTHTHTYNCDQLNY